jgi:hypothetical protein
MHRTLCLTVSGGALLSSLFSSLPATAAPSDRKVMVGCLAATPVEFANVIATNTTSKEIPANTRIFWIVSSMAETGSRKLKSPLASGARGKVGQIEGNGDCEAWYKTPQGRMQ